MFQEETSSSSVSSSPIQMFPLSSSYPWLKDLKPEERGLYLIHLLATCSDHVASGNFENANIALDQISCLASAEGDTMQRIASYFSEALADRILRMWPGVYKAFCLTKIPVAAEELLVRKMFSELLPFMKVSFVITNQAIIEAMEGEKIVHVIDLNASEPMQWCTLLHELSAQPQGPPHLRITGIHQQREVLDQTARSLTEEAEKLDIPFQFIPIVSKLENLDIEMLRVKTGEAVAISSVMQMHELLASGSSLKNIGESVEKDIVNSFSLGNSSACSHSTSPSRVDTFLTDLWALSPKVMVVTEQDSNHNSKNLMERLSESLYFYAALFDCLESTLPRTSLERTKMEKMLLGEEIKNIIACEGADRKHRHEKSGKWHQRFELAGFTKRPLSYYTLVQAKRLLQSFNCDGYKIKEENGCALIYWYDRPLFSISAWRSRR